jgi:two-component system response regulator RegX3
VRQAVREALERRRNVARCPPEAGEELLQSGPFSVDLQKHAVTVDGRPLELTPREFNLLVHLMQNADRVVSPPELVRAMAHYEAEDLYEARQVVKWYVHRLRRKVEPDPASPRYVVNVRGVGYRFEPG